jgi:TonB family protein
VRKKIFVVLFVLILSVTVAPNRSAAQTASDAARKILLRISPQFPSLARSMNIQGVVKAEVLVAPNGTAKSVEIKGGHPLFVQSAQNALREWKWEPGPRETHEIVELQFTH